MDKRTRETLMSSKKHDYGTPPGFFDSLNSIYKFTLDPCAAEFTAKVRDNYYTKEDDGLSKDWSGEVAFVNPPYGRELAKWVKKSYEESLKEDTMVVMLIPSRTDTRYYHDYCMKASRIYFIKGRLKFVNLDKDERPSPAPFPSIVVEFGGKSNGMPKFGTMSAEGKVTKGGEYGKVV